ncbi:hypothetical protein HanIR_Chr17g0858171 [Helianthus annuus]|nr:hypothetical protein HanIR_Chr17g0858171 [Helianthus annuus]
MTEQDKFDKVKIMYQSEEKCNFLFEHCWNLLKDQPKWILRDAAKQRKTMAPPPPRPQPHPQREMSLKMKLSNWIDQWVRKLP